MFTPTLAIALFVVHTAARGEGAWPREVREAALNATVRVSDAAAEVTGSGVVIGREKGAFLVLTAYHVVEKLKRIEVSTFATGMPLRLHKTYREVRIVAVAGGVRDLALLRVVSEDRFPLSLPLCPANAIPTGSGFGALAVGCPEGGSPFASVQVVDGRKLVRRPPDRRARLCWEIQGKRKPGQSGGGLIDRQGRLIGICSGNNLDSSYFTHIEEIHRFLEENRIGPLHP